MKLAPDEKARLQSLPHSGPALAALTLEWVGYVLALPADIVAAFALPDHAPHIVPDYLDECRDIEIPFEIVEQMSRFKADFLRKHQGCKGPNCACETIRNYSAQTPANQ